MKINLVIELEDNVDPVTAARVFSELPRVKRVMSVVDGKPLEMWRYGQHIASEMDHPIVRRQMALNDQIARMTERMEPQ